MTAAQGYSAGWELNRGSYIELRFLMTLCGAALLKALRFEEKGCLFLGELDLTCTKDSSLSDAIAEYQILVLGCALTALACALLCAGRVSMTAV